MRKIKLALTSLLLALSAASFAEKVIITGEPVILEEKNGVYALPDNYTTTTSYYYVTIGGVNHVCYAEKQPSLGTLEAKQVSVTMAGKQVQWNCYPYSDEYFTTTQ